MGLRPQAWRPGSRDEHRAVVVRNVVLHKDKQRGPASQAC